MSVPYVAIVSPTEEWNPAVHQRRDLLPLSLEIEGRDSSVPTATLSVQNPNLAPSELSDKRILISDRGRLIFDGILEPAPIGLVDDVITLLANARPPVEEDLKAAMNALATPLKVSPYWEPLCVPQGQEEEWSEILAARASVVAHSRIQGAPSVVDALTGSTVLTVKPRKGRVRYQEGEKIAGTYGVKLKAAWKELVTQPIELNIKSEDSSGIFDRLETYTWEGIVENFPKAGDTLGDGFSVLRSECELDVEDDRADPPVIVPVEEFVASFVPGEAELDPFIKKLGTQKVKFQCAAIRARLNLEYRWEAERTETAEFKFPIVAQPGATNAEENIEELSLRPLTDGTGARSWQPNTAYEVGDEIADGRFIYRCRVDHTSGATRTGAEWVFVGETNYLAARRISSFFRSARGAAVLAHALERAKTRARFAARKVRVSFEAAMPKPWHVTEDMRIALDAGPAPNRLPGGYATGRLVEYRLTWDRGERLFSGVIACCVGTGVLSEPTLGAVTGSAPGASGRVEVVVENDREAQREALENAQTVVEGEPSFNLEQLPETIIRITTTPAAATSFESDISVPISGSLGFPLQAPIEV
ncbi:hypothetical protein [Ruixingdingia sedimenti]|uniref:Tip attachment protein J domain-containing protein n=1 Tax=Ruixingdingia sedimenti TaxID=3073604 RepID=A0ABU1FDF6_9RHOB|nr:hypothetical protein [Xinfangfangia sp. LG-4]MDR5654884.1 hypothetical protein [Xinfangfangia sp. LG-4]